MDETDTQPIKPFSLTIPNAKKVFGVSRTTIYELAKAGKIRLAHCGRRTLVLYEDLEKLIMGGLGAPVQPVHLTLLQKSRALRAPIEPPQTSAIETGPAGNLGEKRPRKVHRTKRKRGRPRKITNGISANA